MEALHSKDAVERRVPHDSLRSHVELRLAGEVALKRLDGEGAMIRTRKARALLALLGLNRNGLSRQRIVGLLWPDRAEEQARRSLRQAIYELRVVLGTEAVNAAQDVIALAAEAVDVDIGLAEAAAARGELVGLCERLAAMETPMLAGLDGVSEELDGWLRIERSHLVDRMGALGREAAEQALLKGNRDLSRKLVDQAFRLDPLDERTIRTAMRVDAAVGDQAQLHRRFREFERALADDWGAAPAEETRALYQSLRTSPLRPVHCATVETLPPKVTAASEYSADVVPEVRPRRLIPGIAALLALLLVAGAVLLYGRTRADAMPVIAVVPFTTLSPGSQYFASGIAEEVQDLLAHDGGVRVVGRFSASQFRASDDGLATARRLHVTHLLDGSVQSAGDRLRVIVRLMRVSDGALIWSDRYDRRVGDAFAVQSEIAAAVATRFARRPAERATRRPVPLPAVYDRYFAARALMRDRRAVPLAAAERALREAIAQQADYAPIHALLAQVLMLEAEHPVSYGTLPFEQARAEARQEAALAARLDPALGEAQAALGLLTYSNAASLPYYRRAVVLDPQRADFHRWLGQSLLATGQIEEALMELRRAVAVDPLWGLSYEHLIVALDQAGREGEVEAVARRFLSLSNNEYSRLQLSLTFAQIQGRLADGLRLGRRLAQLAPNDRQSRFKYASQLALLGEAKAARAVLDRDDWIGKLALAERGDPLADAVRAHAATFWEVGSGFWGVNDYLLASGHGRVLIELFDKRFGDVRHYRPGEVADPMESAALVLAMRENGRAADAQALLFAQGTQIERDIRRRLAPRLILQKQAIFAALTGNRAGAFAALDRLSRNAPHLLLGIPFKPLDQMAAFRSLAGDPRLAAVDRRLRDVVDAERRKLGWPPLDTVPKAADGTI
jgi:DNA-binding SARP family transcriptional activator/TolB-like protein